jgi:hypothetical protein
MQKIFFKSIILFRSEKRYLAGKLVYQNKYCGNEDIFLFLAWGKRLACLMQMTVYKKRM